MTVGVVIPTYNGSALWSTAVEALKKQREDFDKILIIDSGSSDATAQIAAENGFPVEHIASSRFDHGATREYGIHKIGCDIVVLTTQDAILEPGAISTLVRAFDDESVAIAYGRQIPHDTANPMARHARFFNYKNESYTRSLQDKEKYGIKTAFASDSFSAYRTEIFNKLGGFPSKTIFAEDMFFAAKALMSGYKVSYVAEAVCKHSHSYTPLQEFRRHFDMGVFHCMESWIRDNFGSASSEGIKFVKSELSFLWKNGHAHWIPLAFVNNAFKFLGLKVGSSYQKLPQSWGPKLSASKSFWRKT